MNFHCVIGFGIFLVYLDNLGELFYGLTVFALLLQILAQQVMGIRITL